MKDKNSNSVGFRAEKVILSKDFAAIEIKQQAYSGDELEKGLGQIGNMGIRCNDLGFAELFFDNYPEGAIKPGKVYRLVLEEVAD